MESFWQNNDIEMKLNNVKSSPYIDSNNEKDHNFKNGYFTRILKFKDILVKGFTPYWSKKVFMIKNVKIVFRELILLVILMTNKLLESFTKKNCKKQTKKNLELKR